MDASTSKRSKLKSASIISQLINLIKIQSLGTHHKIFTLNTVVFHFQSFHRPSKFRRDNVTAFHFHFHCILSYYISAYDRAVMSCSWKRHLTFCTIASTQTSCPINSFSSFIKFSSEHLSKISYMLRTSFLTKSTRDGDTDNSSTPISRKVFVRDKSAPSSPHIPTHMPCLWAFSTTIRISFNTAG